eukprot:3395892-Rhodomonas_salina.2
MSGTDVGCRTGIRSYAYATRCAVLRWAIVLCICLAVCGTKIVYPATRPYNARSRPHWNLLTTY